MKMVVPLVNKFPIFYETKMFITVVTNTQHWSLSWASLMQSYTGPLRSSLILKSAVFVSYIGM
jgi:hypothetical protein